MDMKFQVAVATRPAPTHNTAVPVPLEHPHPKFPVLCPTLNCAVREVAGCEKAESADLNRPIAHAFPWRYHGWETQFGNRLFTESIAPEA
jgi:hypothetical protein